MILLAVYISAALGISFLCSMLEAVLLSSRNAVLGHQKDEGNRGAGLLLHIKQTRVDDAISAVLILNTIAHTVGATLAGAQAAREFGNAYVGLFSGVLTFAILVFSEIIPKTLGVVYTRPLSSISGWILRGLTWSMKPALVLSRALTRLMTRGEGHVTSRAELVAAIASATREGTLTDEESRMLENLLRFHEVRVQDVMTPRPVCFAMSDEQSVNDLLSERAANVFSRIPLYRNGDSDDIVGYVLKAEVLKAIADGASRDLKLKHFRRDIDFVPELASIGKSMRQLVEGRDPIAMVTDEHGGVAGLITLEDLTETILGVEIVDESDRIADMRQLAAGLRDRRLERMRHKRQLTLDDGAGGGAGGGARAEG